MAEKASLFPNLKDTEKEWIGMPEFVHQDKQAERTIKLHFRDECDVEIFSELIGQNITRLTKSVWYPKVQIETCMDKLYTNEKVQNSRITKPKYPIYIVSKGRWKSRLTCKALDKMNVPFHIIIEKSEYKKYSKVIDKKKILILPQSYLDTYDTCDDLGDSKSKGPGAARNFCWDYSINAGHSYHWVMDDNIKIFCRFNRNLKVPVDSGIIFRCIEDFVNRYKNIAMAGPNYFMFVKRKTIIPPYILNTRIYSCNLIKNSTPYRWRGRYNEDTDLSLRMLKDRWCTILFNAFLQYKMPTQTVVGGNTKEFYSHEGTLPKSKMLENLHPNIVKVVHKFGRWHHQVYYRHFKRNRLVKKDKSKTIEGINNYGMVLQNNRSRE